MSDNILKPPTVEDLIRAATDKFRARRRTRYIHAGGRGMTTHKPGERTLWLPNGQSVKVTVDDSGHVNQVYEDEALHGIARPDTVKLFNNPERSR